MLQSVRMAWARTGSTQSVQSISLPLGSQCRGYMRKRNGRHVTGQGREGAWTNAGKSPTFAKEGAKLENGFPVRKLLAQKTNRFPNWVPKNAKLAPSTAWLFQDRMSNTRIRRLLKPAQPWSLTHEEYNAIKKSDLKPAMRDRRLTNNQQMTQLKEEEVQKFDHQHPREICKFVAGDRIKITRYVELGQETKFEIIKGYVMGRRNNSNESNFNIINNIADTTFEMKIPVYSPFIKKIELLRKGALKTRKAYYMRDRPFEEFQTR